jgi:heat shock protein HslJ
MPTIGVRTAIALGLVLLIGACASPAPSSPSATAVALRPSPTDGADGSPPIASAPATNSTPAATSTAASGASTGPSPTAPDATGTANPSLGVELDGAWLLVDGTIGDQPIDVRAEVPLSITIDGPALSGSAPCTAFRADIQIEPGGSQLGGLTTTPTTCFDGNAARIDAMFMAAIADVRTIAAAGDRLVLAGPAARLTFERI